MTTAIRFDKTPTTQPPRRARAPAFRWTAANRRRHWARAVVGAMALGISDLGAVVAARALVGAARDSMVVGSGLSRLVASVIQPGTFAGWGVPVAVVLALAIAGGYGPRRRHHAAARVAAASALAALLLLYRQAWEWPAVIAELRLAAAGAVIACGVLTARALLEALVNAAASPRARDRLVVVGGPGDWIDPAVLHGRNGGARARPRVVATVVANDKAPGRSLRRLPWVIEHNRADTVLVAGPLTDRDLAFVADTALASGCRLLAAPRLARIPGVEPRMVWEPGGPLVELTAPGRQTWHLAAKRAVDLCLSSMALALLSPLMVLLGALIRLESPGPAIFAHWRLGERGRLFRCYKFRSMRRDAERALRADPRLYQLYVDNGYKLPAHLDPRLTRIGKVLRKLSLDELPQLLNVLLGDMSLVGPRPIVPEELSHYGHAAPLFLSRKPGITGNWAANGRSDVGYPDRVEVELAYTRQWSLLNDVGLLLQTLPAVARRRGAH